jgi:hypothetical protein
LRVRTQEFDVLRRSQDNRVDLKLLLKRGALLAAANWPVVAIQFVAQLTFQALLFIPIIGAAILVAALLGTDIWNLLQGGIRESFTMIANALMGERVALGAFVASFGIVLVGGSVLMFLMKGGAVDAMLAADAGAGAIESEPLTLRTLRRAARFDAARYIGACARLFRRYVVLGIALMIAYLGTIGAYLAFLAYGYRAAGQSGLIAGWLLAATMSTVALVLWITAVNLIYLLLQIATAADDVHFGQAVRVVTRFIQAEFLELGGIFLVALGMLIAATLASALAWSGVGLIAFVPLVGIAVLPLQIGALLIRGLVFEYIGLTAMGAYITLYRRFAARNALAPGITAASAARPASAG